MWITKYLFYSLAQLHGFKEIIDRELPLSDSNLNEYYILNYLF